MPGAFAVHEVARDLGVLCIHTNSETSALTADPKQHIPNAFRTARQGVHDSIVGGSYAAAIAKAKGLKKWATCAPDYAYGRDTTSEYVTYLALRARRRDHQRVLAKAVPARLHGSRDKILQAKAAGIVFLPVGRRPRPTSIRPTSTLFSQMEVFAVNMADYTALTVVKNLPKGITPATATSRPIPRHRKTPPGVTPTRRNTTNIPPTGRGKMQPRSCCSRKLRRRRIQPTARRLRRRCAAEDQVAVRRRRHRHHARRGPDPGRLCDRLGHDDPAGPYVPQVQAGDWKTIFELEAEWKKSKGYT